jgi:hypothetical protein
MKKNRIFVPGMLAALLIFGMTLSACGNLIPNTDPKTLIVTGLSEDWKTIADTKASGYVSIGIFPAGSNFEDVVDGTVSAVAWGAAEPKGSGPYTVTVDLETAGTTNPWTDSGSFDVYIILISTSGSSPIEGEVFGRKGISFTSAETTFSAAFFTDPWEW